MAISFLEDVWTRNLLNVFVAPVRAVEYLSATFVIGFLRIVVTVLVLAVLALALYAFNILDLKLAIL
ncbi:MAG: ABC transporter permease, partial [Verrucomicrobiota bacterium]